MDARRRFDTIVRDSATSEPPCREYIEHNPKRPSETRRICSGPTRRVNSSMAKNVRHRARRPSDGSPSSREEQDAAAE